VLERLHGRNRLPPAAPENCRHLFSTAFQVRSCDFCTPGPLLGRRANPAGLPVGDHTGEWSASRQVRYKLPTPIILAYSIPGRRSRKYLAGRAHPVCTGKAGGLRVGAHWLSLRQAGPARNDNGPVPPVPKGRNAVASVGAADSNKVRRVE
jgi:hypothetical protein